MSRVSCSFKVALSAGMTYAARSIFGLSARINERSMSAIGPCITPRWRKSAMATTGSFAAASSSRTRTT